MDTEACIEEERLMEERLMDTEEGRGETEEARGG